MNFRTSPRTAIAVALFLAVPPYSTATFAQTRVKPGMNFFSIEQDVEMGREASKEVERQLPLLTDQATVSYVNTLGRSLAKNTDRPDLPWQFKVVNATDVNAFALPGGFIYVNRGLIEAAENEAQLAGVLSHEISHVTLRHGTNQVSKALMIQMPLSILGGVVGSGGWQGALAKLGVSAGAALAFSKFSRTDETQADVVGTQLMTRSGYDPHELAAMFQTLKRVQGREPGKVEQWFASHPDPSNRIERINQEISLVQISRNPAVNSAKFNDIRSRLKGMPPAPKPSKQPTSRAPAARPQPPSSSFRTYRDSQGWYQVSYPDNWRVSGEGGSGVLLSPEGGVVDYNGQAQVEYGAMINVFDPNDGGNHARRLTLEEAADQLADHIYHGNSYLRVVQGSRRATRLAGADAIMFTMEGTSPSGTAENVRIIARSFNDSIIYLILVSPSEEAAAYQDAFRRIARSMVVTSAGEPSGSSESIRPRRN